MLLHVKFNNPDIFRPFHPKAADIGIAAARQSAQFGIFHPGAPFRFSLNNLAKALIGRDKRRRDNFKRIGHGPRFYFTFRVFIGRVVKVVLLVAGAVRAAEIIFKRRGRPKRPVARRRH